MYLYKYIRPISHQNLEEDILISSEIFHCQNINSERFQSRPIACETTNVHTIVSTLTRRGRHYRDRLVTSRREKEEYSLNTLHRISGAFCTIMAISWQKEARCGARTRDTCMTGVVVKCSIHCAISPSLAYCVEKPEKSSQIRKSPRRARNPLCFPTWIQR